MSDSEQNSTTDTTENGSSPASDAAGVMCAPIEVGDDIIHKSKRIVGTVQAIEEDMAKVKHRVSVGYYPLHRLAHT